MDASTYLALAVIVPVAALLALVVALGEMVFRRDRRIEILTGVIDQLIDARVTVNPEPRPRPGVAPRSPFHGGRLPTRAEAPTVQVERVVDFTTAELQAWDDEVEGLPYGHMADASLATFGPGGKLRPIHPTQARRIYRPSDYADFREPVT
jgi:hypothetical protein